ncbi:Phage integrase family protein [Burkholderia vietnamiensis]|nr:Phage integrase family protein [Burkholderia vietnamiensis]
MNGLHSFAHYPRECEMDPNLESKEPQNSLSSDDVLKHILTSILDLPPIIRYYDEFSEKIQSIHNISSATFFTIFSYGAPYKIDFSIWPRNHATLLKHVFIHLLGRNLTVRTAASYISGAADLSISDIDAIISAHPWDVMSIWTLLRAREMPPSAYAFGKSLLRFLCCHRLQGWSDSHNVSVTALPTPTYDPYSSVRSGDAFLAPNDEAAIVRHLDETVQTLGSSAAALPSLALCNTCMLLCSYQFAMRPVQIAMLRVRNVRIWTDLGDRLPAVHLTFHMAKQRSTAQCHPLTRRVKREWAPLFVELDRRRKATGANGDARFFDVQSNRDVGIRIAALANELFGSSDRGTATDLRHTAAQRLVDAGANHEELAEFMGHAYTRTGLVYFKASTSQAERVNRALGASNVYQDVVKIAHARFISPGELVRLKGDQQIAAVPHGISIAGIGGCTSGQPACPYNPVTSCYGCRKFMPVRDKEIHRDVLTTMRQIVGFFQQSSRGDNRSPTYLQLQLTIAEIQSVLRELEGPNS